MGPLVHAGATVALLAGANLAGYNVNQEIAAATILGGFFLDGDKVFEIYQKMKKPDETPDITARCRILHSILAWPFGLTLSFLVGSWLPFVAVLFHVGADSFVPGLKKDGKDYPSHSPRKWIAFPFSKKSWAKVTKGWPITYPPEMNWVYNKLGPAVGVILMILSVLYWYFKV